MLTAETLRGIYSAIVTPFKSDQSIDEQALRKQTEYVIENGCHAIMSTAGTGEFPHMSREERKEVTAIIVDQTGGRIPIIAGTAGVQYPRGHLPSPGRPGGWRLGCHPDPDLLLQDPRIWLEATFFRRGQSARHSGGNLQQPALYRKSHVPPAYGGHHAASEHYWGKLSQDDMGQLVETIRLTSGQVSVNTGIDSQFYPALCVGSRGIFSTASCVIPQAMVDIYDHFRAGRHEEARELHMKVQVLNRFLEYDPWLCGPRQESPGDARHSLRRSS